MTPKFWAPSEPLLPTLLLTFSRIVLRALAASTLTLAAFSNAAGEAPLDVNDVSFLWPVPGNAAEQNKLISLTDKAADGDLMTDEVFAQLMKRANSVSVKDSKVSIPVGLVSTKAAWKVAAIRVNPSSLGNNKLIIDSPKAGEIPSLRLIVQPVSADGTIHDIAAHVVFIFVKGRDDRERFIPDRDAFQALVTDLRKIKDDLAKQHITTAGVELNLHPGFARNDAAGLTKTLKALLQKHLHKELLVAISFMGIPDAAPEPWIFFSSGVGTAPDGKQVLVPRPLNGNFLPLGPSAQMLIFFGPKRVIPELKPDAAAMTSGFGISTALLFGDGAGKLEEKIFPDLTSPNPIFPFLAGQRKDIPDIIADPTFFHTGNTDCASCHSETTRRQILLKGKPPSPFAFKQPAGISPVNKAKLPTDTWNVRAFGWGKPRTGPFELTITQRAANEAAESADFINKNYPPK